MLLNRLISCILLAGVIVGCSATARADILEVQKLRFGKWAVTTNATRHSITIDTNGTVSSSSALIELSPPQVGIYNVDGLPPNTSIGSVDVTMTQPMQGVGGAYFTVEDFTVSIPPTNGLGETTLTLGATAKTSGNGLGYGDDSYQGELHIEINM